MYPGNGSGVTSSQQSNLDSNKSKDGALMNDMKKWRTEDPPTSNVVTSIRHSWPYNWVSVRPSLLRKTRNGSRVHMRSRRTRWWHSRVTCRVPTVRRGWLVVSFRRQFDTQTAWYVRKCAIRNSRWIIGNKGEKNSYFVIEPQEAKFREAQLFVAGRLSYRFYSFYTLSWKCLRDLSAYKNL